MAALMGINPDRINMLTFGIGSDIAGIAGVAFGPFTKVTSELGTDYITRSCMTVVVGSARPLAAFFLWVTWHSLPLAGT